MSHSSSKTLAAIRGATTLRADDPAVFQDELVRLIEGLILLNGVQAPDIVTVFFTMTDDLRSTNPAKIVREHFGWDKTPMLCAQEPNLEGYPVRCIRLLIQFYTDRDPALCKPLYLNEAKSLRPDLL